VPGIFPILPVESHTQSGGRLGQLRRTKDRAVLNEEVTVKHYERWCAMIIISLILAVVGWLCVAIVFEAGYQVLKLNTGIKLPKHQCCWIWWSALGVLSFVTGGSAGLVNMALIFCIAAGHMNRCAMKEEVISPLEIVKHIKPALREVYERLRRILSGRTHI